MLEESILDEGVRDPIVVWAGHGTIVDGHNRYNIATENEISYEIREMEFSDEDAVIEWILRNQLARRNLTDYSRGELILRLETIEAAKARERMLAGVADPSAERQQGRTSEILGEKVQISPRQMAKIKVISEQASDEDKQALRNGESKIEPVYQKVKPKKENPKPKMTGVEITIRWLTTNTYEKFRCSDETGEEIKNLLSEEE